MKVFLDKLLTFRENKYVLSKAAMYAIDKVANIKNYAADEKQGKAVLNVLEMVLDKRIKYLLVKENKEKKEE